MAEQIAFWCSIVGIPGLILAIVTHFLNRADRRSHEMSAAHRKENIMLMKSINANGALAEATALAIQRGHTNGEMEEALKYYHQVRHELKDFLITQNADNLHGEGGD